MDDAERAIRQLRIDARAAQEEAESSAAELARSTRTLRDAVLDFARAGRSLRLETVGVAFSGRVVHVGDDLIRIVRADRVVVDVALSAVVGVHVGPPDAGPATVSVGYPATVVARCRELLQASAHVEIGRRGLASVRGELRAATATHVELAEGEAAVWLVPLGAVAWVERLDR